VYKKTLSPLHSREGAKKRKNFSTYTLPVTTEGGKTTYLENTLKLRKLHKTKVFMPPQMPIPSAASPSDLQGMLLTLTQKEGTNLASSVFFPS
jgi:hypothetical protein